MRSLHLPITWEEFERMPWRFGWKHEYWDSHAHLTPRQSHVHVRMSVEPREVVIPPNVALRSVCLSDTEALIDLFIETFEDGVEFCDWETEKIHAHARRNITDFFNGKRGTPHAVSRLAIRAEGKANKDNVSDETSNQTKSRILAAALFTEKSDAVVLDLLMVRPIYRRRGLATALVATALNDLHRQGVDMLRSAHVISNEESTAWHRAFGFTEELDLHLARLRYSFFHHEVMRLESGSEGSDEHSRLKAEYEFWRRRAAELEEICERDGYEAVMPSLRYD